MATIGRKAPKLPIDPWEDFALRNPAITNFLMGTMGGIIIALLVSGALFSPL
jgi:hypothetical protein